MLIDLLPKDQRQEITECIKILLLNGCDPNMPNEKSRTPFFSLLRVQPKLKNPNELVDYFLEHATIDIYTYKHEDTKRMFVKQNPHLELPEKVEKTVDIDFMLSCLRAGKETDFEVNFKLFKDNLMKGQVKGVNGESENKSNDFAEACAMFLFTAVQNNMESAVELLINENIDVNKMPNGYEKRRSPAFLAGASGYYRILEMILKSEIKPATSFEGKNLLHEICHQFGSNAHGDKSVNYQKCFNLVLDHCDVNETDDQGCTPLHYAVRYRNDEAVKALLKKSSYIGTKNIFNETPIDDINREAFEDFLNDCISTNVRRSGDDEHEVSIDYNFLKAPKAYKVEDEFRQEIAPLQTIAKNSELRPLILHPVLSSFLYLKWSKLSFLFYGNLLLFSTFMISLIVYIVLCQSTPVNERGDSAVYCFFYVLSMISIVVLMIREIFQFILSPNSYIRSLVNWFEVGLIILGWMVLLYSEDEDGSNDTHHRILRAVTILFAAYEFLQLVGTLPILSVSTHMVILKKVAITFLKSIALYSILLLAFALSFYTLFGGKTDDKEDSLMKGNETATETVEEKSSDDEFNSFASPGIAIIKTFVMLTGEFDASSLDLDRNGASYCIIFLLFVFLITIVLFNLLNALAVDDTQVKKTFDLNKKKINLKFSFKVIKAEGQLVDLCQRIDVLYKYERNILSRSGSWRWLKSIISIFPNTIPNGKIVIRPNKSNAILIMQARQSSRDVSIKIEDGQEQELQNLNNNSSLEKIIPGRFLPQKLEKYSTMDPKIMKRVRCVIEERNERNTREKREDALWNHIRSMESQIKILTDLMMKSKNS